MTSCGLNGGPLAGEGTYPAYIACNLFTDVESVYTGGSGGNGFWMDGCFPKITQDGRDGDEEPGYIANMTDTATCGFKYFDCKGVKRVGAHARLRPRVFCRQDRLGRRGAGPHPRGEQQPVAGACRQRRPSRRRPRAVLHLSRPWQHVAAGLHG